MRRFLLVSAVAALLLVGGLALTAANTVPDHDADNDSRVQGINDVKPPECKIHTHTNLIISNDAIVTGTSANDVILGGPASQTIDGLGGDDCIHGGGGNDTLIGGSGTDVIIGGPGTDTCTGEYKYECEL